jgi:hypothetical protein
MSAPRIRFPIVDIANTDAKEQILINLVIFGRTYLCICISDDNNTNLADR